MFEEVKMGEKEPNLFKLLDDLGSQAEEKIADLETSFQVRYREITRGT